VTGEPTERCSKMSSRPPATAGDSTLGRLPPGPSGAAREQIAEIQRARILAAMVDVVTERGAGNVTVAHVVARSGVSRRTFYEQFEDREDCFLAACEDALARIATVVVQAYEEPSRWREKIRTGLAALLEVLEYEPARGRLVIVETLGAGPTVLERRRRMLAQIIAVVDRGRGEVRRGEGPPPLTAEGIVGGVLSLIHSRLLAPREGKGEGAPLVELLGPLMSMIVLPYLGPAAARRELALPVPAVSNGSSRAGIDPLRDLEMRLTYRTMRVLLAVGDLGGRGSHPSNRQVGDAAGIRDQGQISKLLARLQHLGLIENAGNAHAKGEPNAWRLTERGGEVRAALSV
jgi:AcrR family transcriptional regulator